MARGREALVAPPLFRGRFLTSAEDRIRFASDGAHASADPAAVASPADPEDLVVLVRHAAAHDWALVARGAGTSLNGEVLALSGGVVVDLSGWDRIVEIDPAERTARVQPGVINRSLQSAAAEHGLFFPPNPGSWAVSSIGGNVATNASGPRSFAYGPTRDWVRSLEVVLGTGERITVGGVASKRSLGPRDLDLFVGSEGTLGLFTEVAVELAPLPHRRTGLAVSLGSEPEVSGAVAGLILAAVDGLVAIEYVDERVGALLARSSSGRLPPGRPLLLLEVESDEGLAPLEPVSAALQAAGVKDEPWVVPSADELWTLRGSSGTALDAELPVRLREDVAVPVARLGELFSALRSLARDARVDVWIFGHVGDGNLHPNFAVDPSSDVGRQLRLRVEEAARRLGGTGSAEHGVGIVKILSVEREVPSAVRDVFRTAKRRFDPRGILNPGKLYP